MAKTSLAKTRPMNVHVAPRSSAEKAFRALAGIPGTAGERAPGLPATPRHDLIFHGGKTIANLKFKNLYVGGDASWQSSDMRAIDRALAAAMSDQDLNNVMAQYFSQPVTTTALSSEILSGSPPAVVSQADVESMVRNLFAHGRFGGFDLNSTVFNFMLPSGTVLNTDTTSGGNQTSSLSAQTHRRPAIPHDEDNSLNGLGGYHGSVHLSSTGSTQNMVYYAVGVYSEKLADGGNNGIPVWPDAWKNVVATFYHELNEARTDADVEDAIAAGNDPNAARFLGWTSREGEECGDYPVAEANPLSLVFQEVPLTDGTGTVPVQFQYSNAAHGPEGPISQPHPPHAHSPKHHPGHGPSASIIDS